MIEWKRTWEWPEETVTELIPIPESSDCPYCHRPIFKTVDELEYRATRDHSTPRTRGGSDHPDNLKIICARCNSDKGAMTEYEFLHLIETGEFAWSYIEYILDHGLTATRREKGIEVRYRILRDRARYSNQEKNDV